MDGRLSTGVGVIDRHLQGGVPRGSIVALAAPPETGSEQLLRAFFEAHGGQYLTLLRGADEVSEEVPATVDVRHVRPEDLLAEPDVALTGLPDDSVVVVDPVNELEEEHDSDRYVEFLSTLNRSLRGTGSVGVLHCHRSGSDPGHRWLTLARADWVWHVELTRLPLSMETRLYVTKARGGRSLTEPLKLRFGDGVTVDTSRDI